MTPYTQTLIGHLTSVKPGTFTAKLVEPGDGKRPRISSRVDVDLTGQPGTYVAITQGEIKLLASISSIKAEPSSGEAGVIKTIHLVPVGEINAGGVFQNGVTNYPVTGAEVHTVSKEDIESIFVKFRAQGYTVGHAMVDKSIDVCMDPAAMFGRHFAILGQSGAGKSWAVTNFLQRAVSRMPKAHIVLLDLHGEYSWEDNNGKRHCAFDEKTTRYIDARDLEMPYWLMTFSELVDMLIDRADVSASSQISFLRDTVKELRNKANKDLGIVDISIDSPVYFSLQELYDNFEEANKASSNFGKDKGPLAGLFDQFLMRLQSRMNDTRYDFLLNPKHRNSSDTLPGLLRDFVGLGEPKAQITIIDLSSVPFDVRPVVTAQVGRLAFEFNYWNPKFKEFPLLLVCEEAHAYIPREGDSQFEGTRQTMQRIAKEGRKYGVGLAVVTQRPHDLSETVLAQCNTFVCLRLTNPDDQAYVRDLVPEAERDFIDILSSLGQGEAMVMGLAVPLPTRVQLFKPDPPPNSNSVDFFRHWSSGPDDLDVDDIVNRWRRQDRVHR
ncbi:MAG: ATP-binding protein [Gammaproteobacteria bacterium]|nr:ATP-binding protein [Gammaproteobacteria bacterium]NNJ95274.1 ATP-binding protein [Halobacteria archaeon]